MKRSGLFLVLIILMFSLCLWLPVTVNAVVSLPFTSDMDEADFSDWDYDEDVERISDPVYHGDYAANATSDSFTLYVDHAETNPIYVNFYVRWRNLDEDGMPINRYIFAVETQSQEYIWISLYDDGAGHTVLWYYSNVLSSGDVGSTPIVSDTWYAIQIKAEVSSSCDCRLWLDGSLECQFTGDNDNTQGFNRTNLYSTGLGLDYDASYYDWVTVDDGYIVGGSLSADLEDVDNNGADWVFTNWRYYTFTVVWPETSLNNMTLNFTIPTSFQDVNCLFQSDSSNWSYSSDMTYDSRYGEPVLHQAGTWSEDNSSTTVTFLIWFQEIVLDVWEPASAIPVDITYNGSAHLRMSNGFFRIYSQGGFSLNTLSSNSSCAWILPGGTPFSFHVQDGNLTTQSMYNEIWFRDVQHLKLLPEIHFLTHWDEFDLQYGVDYAFGNGSWLTGWYLDITPETVHYNGLFTQAVWINMTVRFYNRTGIVSSEDLYMYNHGSITGSGKPGWWEMWIDLWVSNKDASSVGAGRVNAYEYGMEDSAALWLRWLANNWAPMDDVYKELQAEVPILASDGTTIMSSERVVMWRFWSQVRVFSAGLNQVIEVRNFEHFDTTKSQTLPLSGISSPVFDETIVPVVGSKGLLGALWTMFSSIGAFLSENVLFGGLNLWGAFVDFLDTIAGMFGQPRFFSNLFATISQLIGYLVDSFSFLPDILTAVFQLLSNLMATFLTTMASLITSLLNTFTYFTDMMGGAYGVGVNMWDALGISSWLMVAMIFYPIYLIILWDQEGLDPVLKQLSWLFGIVAWLFGFLVSLVQFVIRLVTSIIESIPIAE